MGYWVLGHQVPFAPRLLAWLAAGLGASTGARPEWGPSVPFLRQQLEACGYGPCCGGGEPHSWQPGGQDGAAGCPVGCESGAQSRCQSGAHQARTRGEGAPMVGVREGDPACLLGGEEGVLGRPRATGSGHDGCCSEPGGGSSCAGACGRRLHGQGASPGRRR